MNVILLLIPIAFICGLVWLGVLLWSIRNGQYEDPRGNAERILLPDYDDKPGS